MADGSEDPARLGAQSVAAPQARPGSFAPFRYRPYREVWMANVLSQIGSQIQGVAAAWLMTELTRAHALVAAVQASSAMAILLFSVPAGALADNYDRRRIMLFAQWAMLAVSAALAVLAWRGVLGAWGLLAFTFAVGAGMTLQLPAWNASLRAMVDARVLPQAISLNSIAFNLARSVGPALGGLVLATSGVSTAFAVNAVSYVALIVALRRWNPDLPPPERGALLPSIRAGIAVCASSRPLRRVLLRGGAFGIGAVAMQGLLPVVVRDGLHGTEGDFGLMLGGFGAGSVVGALFASKLRRKMGGEFTVALGMACSATALLGLAFAPTVGWLVPFPILAGVGWTTCLTTVNIAMQMRSPEEYLGRCLSIYQAITLGSTAVGAWTWGLLADATDVRTALLAAAGWLMAGALLLRYLCPLPRPGEGVVVDRT